jgi:hypothetical protein
MIYASPAGHVPAGRLRARAKALLMTRGPSSLHRLYAVHRVSDKGVRGISTAMGPASPSSKATVMISRGSTGRAPRQKTTSL